MRRARRPGATPRRLKSALTREAVLRRGGRKNEENAPKGQTETCPRFPDGSAALLFVWWPETGKGGGMPWKAIAASHRLSPCRLSGVAQAQGREKVSAMIAKLSPQLQANPQEKKVTHSLSGSGISRCPQRSFRRCRIAAFDSALRGFTQRTVSAIRNAEAGTASRNRGIRPHTGGSCWAARWSASASPSSP